MADKRSNKAALEGISHAEEDIDFGSIDSCGADGLDNSRLWGW